MNRFNYKILPLIILLLVFFASYSAIAIVNHQRFLTFGLDLGYFDETVWKISQNKFPYSGVGCIWLLEDHFQPLLYLIAPLYHLYNSAGVLLIIQAFMMTLTGLPLYFISRKMSGSVFFSLSIVFAYLIFIGTQFSILNEFHQITLAPFFIALFYWGIESRKKLALFSGLIPLFFIKEDLALTIAAMGLGLFFRKKIRVFGSGLFVLGTAFFFLLIYLILPSISFKGIYSHFDFGTIGQTPPEIIVNLVTHPWQILQIFIDSPLKLRTVFISVFTFAFLPFLAPVYLLIPLMADFAMRFIYYGPQTTKWVLVNHHASVSAVFLALSSVAGAVRLRTMLGKSANLYIALASALIFTSLTADFILRAPLHSLVKPQFYQQEKWIADNRKIISKVPPQASVAAQNNLLPHLTHRDRVYRLPYGLNSEYIVMDLNDGPNKYAPLTFAQMQILFKELTGNGRYSVAERAGESYLLKRNYKTDIATGIYYGNRNYCYYSWEEL